MSAADGPDEALRAFATEIGADGPVCVRGGGTRWRCGGDPASGTREVAAPAGIVAFESAEMTVRVRAGTRVAALHEELAASGQRTALPQRPEGTVGGALMVGESAVLRLGVGMVRDALLQARYVCADGSVATGGAGTVKNVSGFDLCRLLVGSLGTLGLIGEALLRTIPIGETERWLRLDGADPREVQAGCHTAMSILWDGDRTWVLLSGYAVDTDDDVSRMAAVSGADPVEVEGPPELPPHRWSLTPADALSFPVVAARSRADAGSDDHSVDAAASRAPDACAAPLRHGDELGRFIVEVGVGVVHSEFPQPLRSVSAEVVDLNRRVKQLFDPSGRLNPGREPLRRP